MRPPRQFPARGTRPTPPARRHARRSAPPSPPRRRRRASRPTRRAGARAARADSDSSAFSDCGAWGARRSGKPRGSAPPRRWRARRTDRVPTSPSGRRTPGGRPSSRAARARGCSRSRARARRRTRATRDDGTGRVRRAGTQRRSRRVWNAPRASRPLGMRACRRVARRLNVAVVRSRARAPGTVSWLKKEKEALYRRRDPTGTTRAGVLNVVTHNTGARLTITSWPSSFRNGTRYRTVARRRSAHSPS